MEEQNVQERMQVKEAEEEVKEEVKEEVFQKQDRFDILPEDISFEILHFLDPDCVGRMAMVSKFWSRLCKKDMLWMHLCKLTSGNKVSLFIYIYLFIFIYIYLFSLLVIAF